MTARRASCHASNAQLRKCDLGRAARYKNGDRGQTYNFSRVFGGDTGQEAFYAATAAPMVRQLTRGLQSSVFMAYGISAAGKTHTIEARRLRPPHMQLGLAYDSKHAHDVVTAQITTVAATKPLCLSTVAEQAPQLTWIIIIIYLLAAPGHARGSGPAAARAGAAV